MKSRQRLVLVDGNALFHRAYHAVPPFTTSKGELVNAVYGFSSMILKVIEELHPEYLAIAWDKKGPTFRHQAYTQYKATRSAPDDGLSAQYKRVYEVTKAFNIPEFALSGYEADDLIGTLVNQASKLQTPNHELQTIIVTGDRDAMQLIDKEVKVYMPKKTLADVGLYGVEEFVARYGFMPIQLIDYKGLAGDASDNIPGVPGIGEVTATKLIHQFGTIEGIYKPENLKTLPERTQTLLSEGAESAVMSKKLATLDLEAPIKLDLEKCLVHDFDKNQVVKLFEELEFRSLIERVPGTTGGKGITGTTGIKTRDTGGTRLPRDTFTTELDREVEPILQKMSVSGVLVDFEFLEKFGKQLKNRLTEIEKEIYSKVGHEFNLNSPKQLAEVLFDELKLTVVRKTKTGRSTDEATLRELSIAHPVIPLILEYRQLFKLVSTYIDALPKFAGEDGRVHSTFNVEGAATGRLSSKDPNLQNIPIKGEMGGEIRKAFIASKGKVLLAADYSQIELRIMAHLADDPGLKKAFQEHQDVHALTASKIFNVPLEEVTKQQRMVGKTMNFATLYGQGPHALSRQLEIPYELARQYIDEYFAEFPKVREWMEETLAFGYEKGYVETLWGRRRYIPELKAFNRMIKAAGERAAVNHPVQGCLPWETKILTSSGYIPIGELYISKEKPSSVWDGNEWKPYKVLDMDEAQLAQIKFSNGQILKCDVRHKVLTVSDEGYEWKEFFQLKPGTKVCFSIPVVHEFNSKLFNYKHTPKVQNGIPLNLVLNKNFWYWIGYYIGDGYLYKRWNRAWVYSLTYFFGEHEQEKMEQCIKFFTSLGLNPTKRKMTHRPSTKLSTRYEIKIHSQGLGKFFEAIELYCGKNARTKCLPSSVFTESLENRSAFIKGIMDSDGYYSKKEDGSPNIHLCQRELLQEIQLLLRTLGVESRIKGPYVYNDRISYRLDIQRSTLLQVLNQSDKLRFDRYLCGTVPQFLVQEAVHLGGHLQKQQFATASDATLYSRWKHGGSSSLSHFQIWLQRNNISLQNPVYRYNEITEIQVLDQFETTYTLSVPGSHRFDSEGVISKNTAADMIKKAMVEIDKELLAVSHSPLAANSQKPIANSCKMILQVHDELLFECNPKEVEATAKMVKEKMENALKLSVPVIVDLKTGPNWGEMQPLKIGN